MNTKVSFWLIPSEEQKAFFEEIITTLAQEYKAPVFTPHVTIYSGEYTSDESPAELIKTATQDIQGFSLNVDQLLYTDQFTKTLFVQFHQSSILTQLSQTLRSQSKYPSNFTLNPHLSLIYQYLSEDIKKNLVDSIRLPSSEVFFNEVRAISTSEKTQNREDVESWKVIGKKKFN